MADLMTLDELFLHEVRDLYDAEQRLTKAIPKLIEAAHATELKRALETHLGETETHVARLEQIFGLLGEKPKGETCEGVKGLLDEGEDLIGEDADEAIADAGLIGSAQKVEHYEIAGYGTLHTWAQLLGRHEVAQLLEFTLAEEKHADQKLTDVARQLNVRAAAKTRA
jgi:ferritin-like metal-binding protein YciE